MKVNPNFVLRDIYGKYILMPIRKNDASDEPIFLNGVAADIWKIAETNMSPDEIVTEISRKYELQKDSMEEAAVIRFMGLLKEQKLLID